MQQKVRALTTSLGFSLALLSFSGVAHAEQNKSPSWSKSTYWQCVTFARAFSGMQLFGDAWTWWQKAQGKYETGRAPTAGSVLVFKPQGRMSRGHVAVVSQIVSERLITVTHANWSPIGGHRGQVEKDVSVLDVSEKGDWSRVKVWYGPIQDLGTSSYSTYGFIYAKDSEKGLGEKGLAEKPMLIASAEDSPATVLASAALDQRPASMKTSVMVRFPARTDTTLSANATPQAPNSSQNSPPLSIEAVLAQRDAVKDANAAVTVSSKTSLKPVETRAEARTEPRIVSAALAEKLTGQKVKASLTTKTEVSKAARTAKKTRDTLSVASTKALKSDKLKTKTSS